MEKLFNAADIKAFLGEKRFAFVGATQNSRKFGYTALKELKAKGVSLVPVNAKYGQIEGLDCYPSLTMIPDLPRAVISMVPRQQTLSVVMEAHQLGIRKIWIQMESENPDALEFCKTNGIRAIHGECILMHAEPVQSFHGVHRFFRKIFGRLPK